MADQFNCSREAFLDFTVHERFGLERDRADLPEYSMSILVLTDSFPIRVSVLYMVQ
jgi:hypothetical protein